MDYEKQYKKEVEIFNNINNCFEKLKENDTHGALKLSKDAWQAYNRWSVIKCEVKKDLGRGEKAAIKERLKEICEYLQGVSTMSRMVWNNGNDDLRSNRED